MDPSTPSKNSIGVQRSGLPLPPKTLIGFLLAVVAVVIIALLSYQSLQQTMFTGSDLTQSVQVLGRLDALLSTLKDAETGQRGFLLTGEESYLTPYTDAKDALPDELNILHALLSDRSEQRRRLDALESLAKLKMAELESTVAARRAGKIDAALAVVHTDRGVTAARLGYQLGNSCACRYCSGWSATSRSAVAGPGRRPCTARCAASSRGPASKSNSSPMSPSRKARLPLNGAPMDGFGLWKWEIIPWAQTGEGHREESCAFWKILITTVSMTNPQFSSTV